MTTALADSAKLTLTAENFKIGDAALSDDAQNALQVKFTENVSDTEKDLTDGVDSTLTATNAYKVVVSIDHTKITEANANTVLTEITGKTISFDVKAVASAK